jgi:Domain of unknown function (DUF4198)
MTRRRFGVLRFRRLACLILLGLAWSRVSLAAHDLWIDPTTFFPEPNAIVGLRLRVGENLVGDPVPRSTALINEFVFQDAAGRKGVIGRDGVDPAGLMRAAVPGLLVVGYYSNPSVVDLTPEKFNQYLKEEGLDAIAEQRARRNQTGAPTREMFSRCAKSLVLSGTASDGQRDQPLGFPLELVAERNPYATAPDQDLSFRLVYENRSLAGALVTAINRLHPSEKLSARTDSAGRVRFRLPHRGMWLVKAVHMIAAPAGSGAEWASYWASVTFELKEQL